MNRENILKVADAIEQHSIPDLGFNMGWLIAPASEAGIGVDRSGAACGTIACIAGHAYAIQHGVKNIPAEHRYFEQQAQWLELNRSDAHELFYAESICEPQQVDGEWVDAKTDLALITPSQAVSVLRHLAKTGEVDWERALNGETV